MRPLTEIIIHCSATPENAFFDASDIDRWHKERGWSGIGYHYVVGLRGTVEEGRPVDRVGAHVKGRNRTTIGVCYVGGVASDGRTPKDTRKPEQKRAIEALLIDLLDRYPSITKISGHRDYAAKACPSFNATAEYAHLVKGRRSLASSRTMQGSAAGLLGGGGIVADSAIDLASTLQEAEGHLNAGSVLGLVIGGLVVAGALMAIYARWDDAGRPMPGFLERILKRGEFGPDAGQEA